jgi:RNA polymerase sigma-70 factor, ECF subfamily
VSQRIEPDLDTDHQAESVSSSLASRENPEARRARTLAVVNDFPSTYAEYFPFVWRCLRSLGVRDATLDDAAQDVFVVVHRRLADFRGDSAFRTWLYGIVRNIAANQRRTRVRRGEPEPLDPALPSSAPGPDEQAADAEAAAFVRSFVAELDDKKRDVFVLAVLEELGIPEVAEIIGIPLNTAYTRLRNVRAEFRDALARRGRTP